MKIYSDVTKKMFNFIDVYMCVRLDIDLKKKRKSYYLSPKKCIEKQFLKRLANKDMELSSCDSNRTQAIGRWKNKQADSSSLQ